jgi:hypothetical protein
MEELWKIMKILSGQLMSLNRFRLRTSQIPAYGIITMSICSMKKYSSCVD